jgi:hypothetical protein
MAESRQTVEFASDEDELLAGLMDNPVRRQLDYGQPWILQRTKDGLFLERVASVPEGVTQALDAFEDKVGDHTVRGIELRQEAEAELAELAKSLQKVGLRKQAADDLSTEEFETSYPENGNGKKNTEGLEALEEEEMSKLDDLMKEITRIEQALGIQPPQPQKDTVPKTETERTEDMEDQMAAPEKTETQKAKPVAKGNNLQKTTIRRTGAKGYHQLELDEILQNLKERGVSLEGKTYEEIYDLLSAEADKLMDHWFEKGYEEVGDPDWSEISDYADNHSVAGRIGPSPDSPPGQDPYGPFVDLDEDETASEWDPDEDFDPQADVDELLEEDEGVGEAADMPSRADEGKTLPDNVIPFRPRPKKSRRIHAANSFSEFARSHGFKVLPAEGGYYKITGANSDEELDEFLDTAVTRGFIFEDPQRDMGPRGLELTTKITPPGRDQRTAADRREKVLDSLPQRGEEKTLPDRRQPGRVVKCPGCGALARTGSPHICGYPDPGIPLDRVHEFKKRQGMRQRQAVLSPTITNYLDELSKALDAHRERRADLVHDLEPRLRERARQVLDLSL